MKMVSVIIATTVAIIIITAAIPIIYDASDNRELDVFVVAGQSNTYPSIYVDSTTATPVPDEGQGYYFGTSSNPTYNKTFNLSECSMYDLNNNGSARIGGLYPSFAADYYDKTGHEVYLIDTGLSGMPIATFLPGGINYDWPGQVISSAMAAIPSYYDTINVRGYIWIQGEGDKDLSQQLYEYNMIRLYGLYSGGALPVDLPVCYICKVRDAQGGNAALAQEWLVDNDVSGFVMASVLPDTFTTDNGLLGPDELHYTQAGFNVLGSDLADNIPAPTKSIDYSQMILIIIPIMIIAVIGGVIKLMWDKTRY